jgi:pSer/pThr/pTyr-binding forkhead associated (FHA) protein
VAPPSTDRPLFSHFPPVNALNYTKAYIIGRHLENDIVLNDTNVSRRHAEFVCAAGEVVVRDMGSTNGTKVNGVVVNGEQLLQHGDVINFGSAQVTFEAS